MTNPYTYSFIGCGYGYAIQFKGAEMFTQAGASDEIQFLVDKLNIAYLKGMSDAYSECNASLKEKLRK